MKIALSTGHGKHVGGAAGYLNEVTEARRVAGRVAELWRSARLTVSGPFNDDTSTTQNQNLSTIVSWHNRQVRDYDVSVHFNAHHTTDKGMGTEVLYVTQDKLAANTSAAIARAGRFIDRGGKKRTNLYFLNYTNKPAILLEICFVDSSADAELYSKNFEAICRAIAETVGKVKIDEAPKPPPDAAFTQIDIKCSVFGGAKDPNDSAYPPFDRITDTEISCALPWRFTGTRPLVVIHNRDTGYECTAEIRDLGPWLIDDPYWELGTRPLAEICWRANQRLPRGPNEGKIPNGAGIDITPAAAKAIGLSGMGQVDWRFTTADAAIA